MKEWKTPELKSLASATLSMKTEQEMLQFLRDLCTLEELRAMSGRWQAVQLIQEGVPYRKIAEKTGLSTATITRIAHWLNEGEGGYEIALERRSS